MRIAEFEGATYGVETSKIRGIKVVRMLVQRDTPHGKAAEVGFIPWDVAKNIAELVHEDTGGGRQN